ncbi:hypothetical protein [Leptothermofonsia sp. ETS-13]|uniref:P-type ATPase n=1 Tax=Leptothermofonsia sp. ETS-13 TaxID=3035696 RepID=UPI003B9E075E
MTALFKEVVDVGVIFAVAVSNALIGYIQEARAENAIAALTEVVTTEATVIGDDEKVRIPSSELVPGDLLLLAAGDRVPADVRLVEAFDLQLDKSALTGESLPVEKSHTALYLFVLGMATLAFAVGTARPEYSFVETFKSAIALAVSAVPEGLPAIVTITLAIGS